MGHRRKQLIHSGRGSGTPICVGIMGINRAQYGTSYEDTRSFKAHDKANRHPYQGTLEAERRLLADAAPHYDEFIILPYDAANEPPLRIAWINQNSIERNYGSAWMRL
jgi:hypothetical protein